MRNKKLQKIAAGISNLNARAGVSIVETVVAILILATIGGAITLLTVQVTEVNNCARLRNEAVKYAEEGLEEVRDFKTNNSWTLMQNKIGCFPDGNLAARGPTNCTGYAPGPPINGPGTSGFNRFVQLQTINSAEIGATSTVSLSAKCTPRSVEVRSYFYDY